MDDENASAYYWDYLFKHGEEYEKMSMREKNLVRYRGGFFVLISKIETSPDRLPDRYFGRTEIETVFNCEKEYIGMLSLNKHSKVAVNGKLMQDIFTLMVYLTIRKTIAGSGRSVSDYIYDLQSLVCYHINNDTVVVNPADRQTKNVYKAFGLEIPDKIHLKDYRNKIYFSV